jgi:hypothetical protein
LKVGSEYFDLVLMALPLKPRPEPSLKGLVLAFCPFLALQRPRETSAFPSGHQAASCLMSTQPSADRLEAVMNFATGLRPKKWIIFSWSFPT